ncbi:hypothetical protein BC829DRAFT_438071 [Chytridium lagenaria]|nr:hypothetical protein BC829DRAFT_438071 [Chytridium lagenaria]
MEQSYVVVVEGLGWMSSGRAADFTATVIKSSVFVYPDDEDIVVSSVPHVQLPNSPPFSDEDDSADVPNNKVIANNDTEKPKQSHPVHVDDTFANYASSRWSIDFGVGGLAHELLHIVERNRPKRGVREASVNSWLPMMNIDDKLRIRKVMLLYDLMTDSPGLLYVFADASGRGIPGLGFGDGDGMGGGVLGLLMRRDGLRGS